MMTADRKSPPAVPLMDTTMLFKELRATVRQWNAGRTTHESSMERVAELLKMHDTWSRRKC